MSSRAAVLSRLSFKVGFPFTEAELSPPIRRKIGELEAIKTQIDSALAKIYLKQNELAQVQATKTNLSTKLFHSRQVQLTMDLINREIANLNASLTDLYSRLTGGIENLTNEIFSELSASHQAKIALTANGPGMRTVKETIREVVMVPCAYCRALMPQTSLACPTCGAKRRA